MKILFSPFYNTNNRYVSIIIEILKNCDFEVLPLKKIFSLSKTNYVVLNWVVGNTFMDFIKLLFLIVFIKIKKIKIIYTFHNITTHDKINNYWRRLSELITFKYSYKIIIHNNYSGKYINKKYHNKTVFIPHPNYVNEYGKLIPTEHNNKLRLLFFGLIRPYKNIELLIQACSQFPKDDIELTIAGKPCSEEYQNKIKNLIKTSNIKCLFKFIENKEIPILFSKTDILILPYDLKSCLNSGVIILAFSYAKTVISPYIGTLRDFEDENFLTYTYSTEEEHLINLTQSIKTAVELKRNNNEIFDSWGQYMFNVVNNNNSKEIILKNFKEIFNCFPSKS